MTIGSNGVYSRPWKFVDRAVAGEPILRSELDIALDDVANGIRSAMAANLGTMNIVGEWVAGTAFPTTRPGGAAIQVKDTWVVSTAGTTNSVQFYSGDFLYAQTAGGGATYSGHWLRVPSAAVVASDAATAAAASAASAQSDAATVSSLAGSIGTTANTAIDSVNDAADAATTAIAASSAAATASASAASSSASAAAGSASAAATSATAAQVARDATIAGASRFYVDTTAGLAAVALNEYFTVPQAGGADEAFIVYKETAGPVATEITRVPSFAYMAARFAIMSDANTGANVPLVTVGKKVPIWMNPSGQIEASALSPTLKASVSADYLTTIDTNSGQFTPLIGWGAGAKNIALWLDNNGLLNGVGISPQMLSNSSFGFIEPITWTGNKIPLVCAGSKVLLWMNDSGVLSGVGIGDGNSALYAPRVSSSAIPATTDGRSLSRARAAAAKSRAASGSLRIALLGDSWHQGLPIPNAYQAFFAGLLGGCEKSWIHANTSGQWSGVSVSVTASGGWTLIDADSSNVHPYGQGPDGQMLWTSGATETITITTAQATEIRLYTRKQGGTFRYRVDGGSWTTVADGVSDNSVRITTITGLTDTNHTVNIDTTGNAGVVAWVGAYTTRSAAKAEILKMGNGGITGFDTRSYFTSTTAIWADLNPDLVVICLGTNDYIYAESPVSEYTAAITEMVATLRSACGANVGIVLVAPALSPSAAVAPLYQYRDAAYSLALALGVEFLNLYDTVAPYAIDPSIWTDNRHLNQLGGDVAVRLLYNRLLGV